MWGRRSAAALRTISGGPADVVAVKVRLPVAHTPANGGAAVAALCNPPSLESYQQKLPVPPTALDPGFEPLAQYLSVTGATRMALPADF